MAIEKENHITIYDDDYEFIIRPGRDFPDMVEIIYMFGGDEETHMTFSPDQAIKVSEAIKECITTNNMKLKGDTK